ncbi:cytochrome P450 [Umbelopsis sp. PMI_123]|nr:cytochrome P450 [Umbelopsis sp. PMI_123]
MQLQSYMSRETVKDAIGSLFKAIGQLSRSQAIGVLGCSLTTYYVIETLLLNHLGHIPGPFLAKLSRFYEIYLTATRKRWIHIQALHDKYGTIVRTGYKSVSIRDPAAFKLVYRAERFQKAPFYQAFTFNGVNNLFTANTVDHARYRRILAPGFSQATLDSLEDVILDSGVLATLNKFDSKYCDKNVSCNLFTEFGLLSFDIVGELVYGKSFDMIGLDSHPFPGWLRDRSHIFPLVTTYPSLNDYPKLLDMVFPNAAKAMHNILKFAADSLDERASDRTINRRDFAQLILEAINSRDGGDYLTPDEGLIATVILIITGTVTTSIMLTCITYVLGKHQDVKEKLFQELVQAVPEKNSTISYKNARKDRLPYLWAVIMEVSRMYPAVPGGMPRVVPKGGAIIAGKYIPEETIVDVPIWSIHHDASVFEDPFKFKPERWLREDAEELMKHHVAFSVGPRMCAGKNLAMMEMTLTLAHLYRRYDVCLVNPEEDMEMNQLFGFQPASRQMNVYIKSRDN